MRFRRCRALGFAALGLAFLLAGRMAASAAAVWSSLGPPGGVLNFVAAAPSAPATVYASSRVGGVFASDDSGATWRVANAGLSDLRIRCLAVSPNSPGEVYAGAPGSAFKTTDGGRSWTALGNGFPAAQIDTFAIDPTNASTVYAAGTTGTLVRSTDGGASWSGIGNSVLAAAQPRILAVDPSHSSTIYLGTFQAGLFRSDDGGGSWTPVNNGLTDLLGNPQAITAVAIDPTSPSRVYAGTATALVYRSDDHGANWTSYGDPSFSTQVVTLAVAADGTLFAALQQGIFARRPSDPAWGGVAFVSSFINAAAIGSGPVLYAAFGNLPFDTGGFARWDAGGAAVEQLPVLVVAAIAADPQTSSRALVATTTNLFIYQPGDPTGPWDPPSAQGGGATAFDFAAIAVYFDPRNAGVVYAGGGGKVQRSTDAGVGWTPSTVSSNPTVVRSFVAQPGTLQGMLAGTSTGLYQSADGTSWSAGSGDLSARQVFSLAADPTAASTLWAGADDGVYRSDNSGALWTKVPGSPGGVVHAVLVSRSGTVLAGSDSGLFVSADRSSWAPAAAGSGAVFALVENGATGEFAAGTATGVFVSTDGGVSWAAQTNGLTNPDVFALAYLGDGTLVAGTNGGSVFQRTVTAPRATVSRVGSTPPAPRSVSPRP
jgi:photosystem II stability/assembly factor-like uncharacterized protein